MDNSNLPYLPVYVKSVPRQKPASLRERKAADQAMRRVRKCTTEDQDHHEDQDEHSGVHIDVISSHGVRFPVPLPVTFENNPLVVSKVHCD